MKLLYIITQADGGGAQTYVLSLARHFSGSIAAGSEAGILLQKANELGLATYTLRHLKRNINPWHDFLAIWEIRQLIQNLDPDIIHLNSSKAGVLGSFACIGLKNKIIYTAHGFVFNEPMPFWLKNFYIALEKLASEYRNYIISVSDKDRESALAFKLISPDKISTVHNGLAQTNFLSKEQSKAILNLTKEKFIFGIIANFYKTKGLDVLIDSVNLLPNNIKEHCLFTIIGDGPEFNNLKLKIKNYELGKNFLLTGNIPNANKYLKAFDALILPSRKEGFSYVILEAMQAGLPIIATNVGGTPEAIEKAGILVEPENPEKLSEAIAKLFLDNNLQKELSQKALVQAQKFTETKMLEETEKIYRTLLK